MTAADAIRTWREDPVKFVRDNFNVEPEAWQIESLQYLAGFVPRRRLCMRACTGPGKSALLSWAGWHRLACYGDLGEHPKGAAVSGEGKDNLIDNLWAEMSKWREQSEFLREAFEINSDSAYAKQHSDTWFLSTRSYPKDANTEAIGRSLSGLHSRYPFLLLDEIGDMPAGVGKKAEQIFTGSPADSLIACAGNPTSTSGLLYYICTHERDRWQVVRITGDPDDPKRSQRVDIELAREQIAKYTRDDDWVRATILGEFPKKGLDTLLSVEEVEAAMRRNPPETDYQYTQKRLGVDVARFGLDTTVIYPRQGLQAFNPVVMRGARSTDVAARVAAAKDKWGSDMEFIDGTGGHGAGVVDALIQAGHTPVEVNFSGAAQDDRYFNTRSEIWFRMAEWVKRGGALPYDPELIKELTAPKKIYQNGKFRLEEKEQIKKRLGFSPDKADALACTFFLPDMPNNNPQDPMTRILERSRSGHQSDFDPYSEEFI